MSALKVDMVVPAAGCGRRMGSAIPKQYLMLGRRSILETVLLELLRFEACSRIIVALDEADEYFIKLECASSPRIVRVPGGPERSDSVLSALEEVRTPWVMVHDAVRPFVSQEDLNALLSLCNEDGDGGLLATPVCDTLKLAEGSQIQRTVPRAGLWRALTPQLFKTAALKDALLAARARGTAVTDDASAMEIAGFHPRLVEGRGDNFKITTTADLQLARVLARSRGW